ncbi:hypothetical protein [Umezawaea beigongshangensis]|uniref:hypothetical protein n=1 Tax=Umezawaea beigongshangensis TaxID=2780383 RepID=UPI0018F14DB2|nr:hypothetical protein [Umezawaea beigongshangensis]
MKDESTGRLAEELRLLLDTAAERAQPWLQRAAAAGEQDEHTPQTCGWCPVCNTAAVLRGDRSELAAKAAEHVAGLIAVLRTALAEPAATTTTTREAPPEPAAAPPEESRVQHIQVVRRSNGC